MSLEPALGLKTALFWISIAVCAIAQGAIIRSAFKTQTTLGAGVSRTAEIFWTILPAIGLVILFWFTWQSL